MSSKPAAKRGMSSMLCSACSASLPPAISKSGDIFTTPCCQRPICPACLASNPRLARYNPCLSCLGGVSAVSATSRVSANTTPQTPGNGSGSRPEDVNIDGAVRDSDVYILGDDEDEDDADGPLVSETPPPAYEVDTPPIHAHDISSTSLLPPPAPESEHPASEIRSTDPSKYYLKQGDTLLGIALRFGIDGRDLCRLNNLPPSTLSTTPHILHTRRFITLPKSAKTPPSLSPEELHAQQLADSEHRARRAREQAEKRLQTLTKETDWRVARAYVALADDPEEEFIHGLKSKELSNQKASTSGGGSGLEDRAIDQYLDDEEWEVREMRAGRQTKIASLGMKGKEKAGAGWTKLW